MEGGGAGWGEKEPGEAPEGKARGRAPPQQQGSGEEEAGEGAPRAAGWRRGAALGMGTALGRGDDGSGAPQVAAVGGGGSPPVAGAAAPPSVRGAPPLITNLSNKRYRYPTFNRNIVPSKRLILSNMTSHITRQPDG